MSSPDNNGDKTANQGSGHLEISEKGFGFLRTAANHFHPKPTDIFAVSTCGWGRPRPFTLH